MNRAVKQVLHVDDVEGVLGLGGPTVTCLLCGNVEAVTPDGRGFPPDIAKRRLRKRCRASECPCDPTYRPGITFGERSES